MQIVFHDHSTRSGHADCRQLKNGLAAFNWRRAGGWFRAIIAGLLLIGLFSVASADAFVNGETAPGFTLPNRLNQQVSLKSQMGHPVVLKLGTTWCPGCIQETRELKQLEPFLNEHGASVVEVFLQDSWSDIDEYFRSLKQMVPDSALLDDGSVVNAYQVYAIPRLLLIDSAGRVFHDSGFLPADEIKRQFEKVLK